MQTVSLSAKFAAFQAQWTPHRIARFDDHQLLIARVEGEFVWHTHADHDEVFIPIAGELLIDFEDAPTARVRPGELLVVPKGTPHRPRTDAGECQLLLIDPNRVQHTGEVHNERTVVEYPDL